MKDKILYRSFPLGIVSRLPLVGLFGCAWMADRWPKYAPEAILIAFIMAFGQCAFIYSRIARSKAAQTQQQDIGALQARLLIERDFSTETRIRESDGEQADFRLGSERLANNALSSAIHSFAAEWSQFSAVRSSHDSLFERLRTGDSAMSVTIMKDGSPLTYARFVAAAGPVEVKSRDGHIVVLVVNESRAKSNLLWSSELERLLENAQERPKSRPPYLTKDFSGLLDPLTGTIH